MAKSLLTTSTTKLISSLILALLIIGSCSHPDLFSDIDKYYPDYNVDINLECQDSVVYSNDRSIELKISLSNKSADDIAIIDSRRISLLLDKENNWYCNIVHESGVHCARSIIFDGMKPISQNYSILRQNEQYVFPFRLYFPDLLCADSIPQNVDSKNSLYGNYYIQIFYLDMKQENKQAVKRMLKSNVLMIRFEK